MMKGMESMTGPLQRVVIVNNPQGLHIRPAAAFAELAQRFDAKVTVTRSEQTVNGKLWPDLLLLAAEQGTELLLEVDGSDAGEAIVALAEQLGMVFPDEAPAVPPKG